MIILNDNEDFKKDEIKRYLENKYVGFIVEDILSHSGDLKGCHYYINMIFDVNNFKKYDCTPMRMYLEVYYGCLGIEELCCKLS